MKRLIIAAFAALSLVSNLASQATSKTAPYTGDGGKGMSLAVLVPGASGLAAEQNYLPTMVQGVLVGDISKYSAIKVLDRQTLEKTLKETESGIYKNEADYGQLGQIANVDYALTGNITKTGSGYAMQIQVVGTGKNNIGVTKASYSGSCTIAELDNFTGIRKASLELLTQMGVALTSSAKQELSGAGQTNYVNAQTSLAQGIVAQRSGNIVETMARFYEANNYDPSLAEAAARANTMSASIRTGSLRENIRNDIAWRDEWVKILNDAKNFILAHPPVIAQVIYDPALKQGKTDYNRRTVDFELTIDVKGVPYPPAYIKMVADLNAGLFATRRNGDKRRFDPDPYGLYRDLEKGWDINPLSVGDILSQGYGYSAQIDYTAELVNSGGKVIAQTSEGIQGGYGLGKVVFRDTGTAPNLQINSNRRDGDWLYPVITSFTAKADDITDQMTVRLSVKVWPSRDFRLYDNSSPDFSKYLVEVITRETYLARVAVVNGQPPMLRTRKLDVYRYIGSYSDKLVASITVEIPSTPDERELLLSYRPSLADGRGVFIQGIRDRSNYPVEIKGLPEYIDTTHYRFPVSVAYLYESDYDSWTSGKYYIIKIIDIEPGRREPVPKEIGFLESLEVMGIVIAPKGWFKREKIRTRGLSNGDYFKF